MNSEARKPLLFDAGALLSAACSPNAMAALERRYSGTAKWVTDVQNELLHLSSKTPPNSEAGKALRAGTWLGHPIVIDDEKEMIRVEELRRSLAKDLDDPRQHLGECSSIVVALREEGSVLVSDDRGARSLAVSLGVAAASTPVMLSALVKANELTCAEAWNALSDMSSRGRKLGVITQDELCSGRLPASAR